jgi:cysteine desulfurase
VIFTSCATESNNAAIHAALKATGKKHVVTSAVEHSSVLNLCKAPQSCHPEPIEGSQSLTTKTPSHQDRYRITYLPVDRDGLLRLADLENAITEETAVVSVLSEANGSGRTDQADCTRLRPLGSAFGCPSALRLAAPSGSASEICRWRGVLFHCDAVQAASTIQNAEL